MILFQNNRNPDSDFSGSSTTGNPTSYFWIFEPSTSNDWNSHHAVTAVHTFKKPGVYTISLVVSNSAGSTTVTKNSYIHVY
ncbi:PKD domain-containing protein [Methanosarcina sp.]|uniref:PKD domain-containing protein n=1 Tax=Methanosarcina sp. TaxID=2213 RepID=UPI003BB732C0